LSLSTPAPIAIALDRLRCLTQTSIQTGWRCCDQDLPIAAATQPQTWETWAIAALNEREHIAWAKGRKVCWLAQTIVVPADLAGYPLQGLSLRLALLWWAEAAEVFVNGQFVQAGDLFDCAPRLLLKTAVIPGENLAIALRLISPGHDDGALMRSVCHYEAPTIDEPPEPAFVADELAVLQTYLHTFAPEQLALVTTAVEQIDWSGVAHRTTFDQSLRHLRQSLLPLTPLLKQRRICLLGHAHLDMAWLWTIDETWKAAERTFESVLSLQKEFSDLIFCHSTPALYEWIEQHRPDLFARIRQQIAAGNWEPIGGLWIEPEMNLISGEAIARQILYGQRYWQTKFGSISPFAWLPDTFGFNWQLPQLLKQGGIDYFVTQKLRWNDTTKFPYDLFWWQAPDGTHICSLMSAPIGEGIDPIKMATYACEWEQSTGRSIALWLPGVGDHGGGPTRDMLEVAQRWAQSDFFPQLEFLTAADYLHQISPSAVSLPIWNDELYLEFHRGCYTTHADQKRSNRTTEVTLYQAELWATLATICTGVEYPTAALETAWKKVLFNQFHDILPGSSITQVFEDANREWAAAEQLGWEILQRSQATIAAQIALPSPPVPTAEPIVVFNSLNWSRSELVELALPEPTRIDQIYDSEGNPVRFEQTPAGNGRFWAQVPGVGYRVFWLCSQAVDAAIAPVPVKTAPFVLENAVLRVTVDAKTGDLSSVFDRVNQREVLSGAGNQLQAFRDQGQYWDAWNIAPDYEQHPLSPAVLQDIRWVEQGELRSAVRVIRCIGTSTFEQTYSLEAASPLLKIATQVDWQERHVLVKAAFSLNLTADLATYEIPCGAIARSICPQTESERAKWEVPALRWASLSQDAYGVSLLNDGKHGYDCTPNQIRLTLLRGSEFPDPEADLGNHSFTYALYPHAGNWQVAQTVRRGYELNDRLSAWRYSSERVKPDASLPPVCDLLDLGAANLVLMAFKQAEDRPAEWVLRCYECDGETAKLALRSPLNLKLNGRIDLLEQACNRTEIQGQTTIVHPWQIVSFAVAALSDS
jgi:alpha-mannosidase